MQLPSWNLRKQSIFGVDQVSLSNGLTQDIVLNQNARSMIIKFTRKHFHLL